MSPPDLRRQVQLHVRALALAGVEFVPLAAPPPVRPASPQAIPEPSPADARRVQLDRLAAEVARCDRCPGLFSTRTQTVFGAGPVGAEVCFVGDAPWADDDREGQPFRGDAGALLDKILTAMGLARTEVYLTTAIKCRPPRNRTPNADECGNCRGHLDRQLELVGPRALCCLGAAAAQTLLNTPANIQALRGTVHDYRGTPVVCTYHPAYVLRNPAAKKDCWEDLKLLLRTLGRPLPAAKG
jgi:DNA polymerase